MKVYIAGKITGLDREATLEKFEKARQWLAGKGHTVLVPTVLPESADLTHEDYLHICYAMIDVCDTVYFLPDWIMSEGAKLEKEYAKKKRKGLIYGS